MARSARLKLGLLAGGVVLGHLAALEWLERQADALSALQPMAPPMLTRLLMPAKPPPVPVAQLPPPQARPRPRARIAAPPQPAASAAAAAKEEEAAVPAVAEPPGDTVVAQAEPVPVPAPEPAPAPVPAPEPAPAPAPEPTPESEPEPQLSPPLASVPAPGPDPEPVPPPPTPSPPAAAGPAGAPASAAASIDRWPVDTRLSYDVSGHWRGPLYGTARVQWQREDRRYQVRLEVDLGLFSQVLTSQGEVTPQGLRPQVYEEFRPGKRRTARIGDEVVTLESGRILPRPEGVQDTASQFVELSQRFAGGLQPLEVGRSVSVWLARPGGVDRWTYDIVEREMLRLPRMGEVEAFRLVPRPIDKPRGSYSAQMWFAPSLQYLPVRIRVNMGSEAWIDLVVEKIEQR